MQRKRQRLAVMARAGELAHKKVGVKEEDDERHLHYGARKRMVAAQLSPFVGHVDSLFVSQRHPGNRRVKIRAFQPGDLDAMHALDVICFDPPFRFTRSAMRRFAEARKARVVIAEIDGAIVGFGIVHVEQAEAVLAAYIVTLDVSPERRRVGVARLLMSALQQRALDDGCSMIALHVFAENSDAIGFYEHLGFARSHRARDFYGDGLDALVYHKVIQPLRPKSEEPRS